MSLRKGSQNLINSWWTHTEVVREAGTDNILFAGVMEDGDPRIFRFRPTDPDYTTIQNKILYDAEDADDHNSVSILSIAGKDLVVFWQRHIQSPYLNFWIAPEGTFNFGTKQRITFPSDITYNQILNIGGDESIALVRCSDGWYFTKTTDHWQTYTEPVQFINPTHDSIYMNFQLSPTVNGLFHFAGALNPATSGQHYIVYGTLEFTSGDVTDGSGNVIGNIHNETGLPFTELDFFDIQASQNVDQKIRLLDIYEVYGIALIEYCKFGGNTPLGSAYYQARIPTPGTVVRQALGIATGAEFGPTDPRHYIAGTAIDRVVPKLYVATEASGNSALKSYPINSDFTLGTPTTIQTNNTYRLVRPYPIRGKQGCGFQELRKYLGFKNYRAHYFIYEA